VYIYIYIYINIYIYKTGEARAGAGWVGGRSGRSRVQTQMVNVVPQIRSLSGPYQRGIPMPTSHHGHMGLALEPYRGKW
jgi:hypothetical protein